MRKAAPVLIALTVALACSEDDPISEPTLRGTIEVTTTTTGKAVDQEYGLVLNDGDVQPIGANDTRSLSDLAAVDHDVELTGIAANCTLDGPNRRTLRLSAGETASVSFDVSCAAGALEVSTSTHGREADADGYVVSYHAGEFSIGGTDAVLVDEAPAQDIVLELAGLATACAVVGDNPRTVAIPADGLIFTAFDVVCQTSLQDQIVFSSFVTDPDTGGTDAGIYVMNADGSGQFRLTPEGMDARLPAVSPDGRRIVFVHDSQIHVMAANGSGWVLLTQRRAEDGRTTEFFDPVWSPDGARIAFAGRGFTPAGSDILVMNADGTGLVNLTKAADSGNSGPTWSPDGTRIAFASSRDADDPTPFYTDIFVMNADGSDVVRLTDAAEPGFGGFGPAWSHDGSRIAFTSADDSAGGLDVWLMNADGSNQEKLTAWPAGPNQSPSWARDDSEILFVTAAFTDDLEVFSMRPDGSEPVNLTNRPASRDHVSRQAWSP